MAGAYPASVDDNETETILTKLLELGIDTFVCLQAEFWLGAPDEAWKSGQALRPYVKDAHRLLIRAKETGNRRITQSRLDLLHLPIIDGNVTSDHALSRLADDCCQRILNGERIYIHCWGGHGRTGTLVAIVLARLYGLTSIEALAYTQALHDVRRCPQGVRSPQTQVQIDQVRRILSSEKPGDRAMSYKWPSQPLAAESQHPTNPGPPLSYSMMVMAKSGSFVDAGNDSIASTKQAAVDAMDPPLRTESLIPAVLAPSKVDPMITDKGESGWNRLLDV